MFEVPSWDQGLPCLEDKMKLQRWGPFYPVPHALAPILIPLRQEKLSHVLYPSDFLFILLSNKKQLTDVLKVTHQFN